ncbi:MAG: helix-turn-helix transcriptional regulator [Clostridia bacterium]|nr:helix-turn-helix transcriptional regulator [Clostridia bacterium]
MTFSDRLTAQRKRKGVSQKQAAADLGISQALLSHYENGIREPGLSFLVKAADYYNVSCDYLLGHAANVLRLNQAVDFEDLPEDAQLSRETFIRADLAIMNSIVEDEEMMDTLVRRRFRHRSLRLLPQADRLCLPLPVPRAG